MRETETIVDLFRDKLFEWFNSDEIFDSRAYNTCKPYRTLVDELEGTVNKIADELKAENTEDIVTYKCPRCGKEFEHLESIKPNFCMNCGCGFYWEDDEEE